MILIASIALIFCTSWILNLPQKLTSTSLLLHQFCLQQLPQAAENLESLEALVCGKNLQDIELQQLLVHTSLIHLFVVSGSHFILLHKFFIKLCRNRFIALIPLGVYSLVTLCQPPAIRALLFLSLSEFSKTKKKYLSTVASILVSGLLCVAIFPQWISSRSFIMSLAASLAISLASDVINKTHATALRAIVTQIIIYIFMAFCLWGASNLHPLSILLNLTLGTVIGSLLFPLGLLITIFPPLTPVFDRVINILFWILIKSNEVFLLPNTATPLRIITLWILFLGGLSASHIFLVKKRRSLYET